MRLSLRQLDVFLAISQASSLTQAANRLCMTKSAVSQTLAELERQLGCTLFDRCHGRLIINAQGQRLIPLADELHVRVDEIADVLAGKGEPPSLIVGASRTIAGYVLPPLLARFQRLKGWMPHVVVDNTRVLQERLLRFECDMAMVEGTIADETINVQPWQRDTLAVLCATTHPLMRGAEHSGTVAWHALESLPWVLREVGSGTRDQYDYHIRPNLRTPPQIVLEMASFDAIMASVAEGLGVTFGSTLLVKCSGFRETVSAVPLPSVMSRQLSLCHHRGKYLSAAAQQWMTFVAQHAS